MVLRGLRDILNVRVQSINTVILGGSIKIVNTESAEEKTKQKNRRGTQSVEGNERWNRKVFSRDW